MKRFMLGFTDEGAELLDGRDMTATPMNATTVEAAQSHVDFRNLIHEKLVRLDREDKELEARVRADFKGRFGDGI